MILLFTFYKPVFYAMYAQNFPDESDERAHYWVGFGDHCGGAMTHKHFLDHETQKNIYRSAVRPRNLLLPTIGLQHMEGRFLHLLALLKIKLPLDHHWGPEMVNHQSKEQKAPTVFIMSSDEENPSGSKPMSTFDPTDLIGRTFLLPPEENGERHRAKVTRKVVEIIDQENGHRVENINFILYIGKHKVEELISYNQLWKMPKTMTWAWIKNFKISDPSLDIKLLWLHQIQIGKAANIMFKWSGRLGRSHMNPSPSLLLMTQLPVQHMPKRMIFLL